MLFGSDVTAVILVLSSRCDNLMRVHRTRKDNTGTCVVWVGEVLLFDSTRASGGRPGASHGGFPDGRHRSGRRKFCAALADLRARCGAFFAASCHDDAKHTGDGLLRQDESDHGRPP